MKWILLLMTMMSGRGNVIMLGHGVLSDLLYAILLYVFNRLDVLNV